jgi:DNA invertase Pin-like site-specific DNA recombinase
MNIRAVILARVSTAKQETDRQITELQAVAKTKGWEVVAVIAETISGASKQRPDIARVLDLAKAGEIEKVMVHEVSRIARRGGIARSFLDELDDLGVSLYWHSQSIETRLENGKRNPAAGIMFALLSEIAASERETLVERTKSGLDEARRKGKTLGRPVGSTISIEDLLAKHPDIVKLLKAGQSIRHCALITGKSKGTVSAVKAALKSTT